MTPISNLVSTVYCIVEKDEFADMWYDHATGGPLDPRYVMFFLNPHSTEDALKELRLQNPQRIFDVMPTTYTNFTQHWSKSDEWTLD